MDLSRKQQQEIVDNFYHFLIRAYPSTQKGHSFINEKHYGKDSDIWICNILPAFIRGNKYIAMISVLQMLCEQKHRALATIICNAWQKDHDQYKMADEVFGRLCEHPEIRLRKTEDKSHSSFMKEKLNILVEEFVTFLTSDSIKSLEETRDRDSYIIKVQGYGPNDEYTEVYENTTLSNALFGMRKFVANRGDLIEDIFLKFLTEYPEKSYQELYDMFSEEDNILFDDADIFIVLNQPMVDEPVVPADENNIVNPAKKLES